MSRLGLVIDKKFNNVSVAPSDGYVIVSSPGNLPYAGAINTTGVPILDGVDSGNYEACFVGVVDATSAAELLVLSGPSSGNRIIGFTFSNIPGDSVEIRFYSVSPGSALSTATAYTWEVGQPTSIDLYYGFRQRQDQLDGNAIRFLYARGILTSGSGGGSGITATQHAALRQLIHLADGVGGPFEEYLPGAYREILPVSDPFPTSIIWWESSLKIKKIVEKTITRNPTKTPAIIEWKSYDTDGSTVLATVTDTIVYSGIFELNRTRAIS